MRVTVENHEVDLSRIKQEKVREYVVQNGLQEPNGFAAMQTSCYDPAAKETYHTHHETFVIRQSVADVWRTYTTIEPKEAWNGEMVSFGLQYSRRSKTISYLEDGYTGMEVGQVIILHLRLFWGLLKIAVAHEVVEVNETEKLIKLCYMAGGASVGSQWIVLHETGDGHTEVSHKTLYKSSSTFRDTRLYPRLHTKAIAEFHRNVKRKAEFGVAPGR